VTTMPRMKAWTSAVEIGRAFVSAVEAAPAARRVMSRATEGG
jgi:hypothetical protein